MERYNTEKKKEGNFKRCHNYRTCCVERKTKKRRKKTIVKVKYNDSWCVAQGTQRIEETGQIIVDWGKGKSTTYEEKDFKVKVKN